MGNSLSPADQYYYNVQDILHNSKSLEAVKLETRRFFLKEKIDDFPDQIYESLLSEAKRQSPEIAEFLMNIRKRSLEKFFK